MASLAIDATTLTSIYDRPELAALVRQRDSAQTAADRRAAMAGTSAEFDLLWTTLSGDAEQLSNPAAWLRCQIVAYEAYGRQK